MPNKFPFRSGQHSTTPSLPVVSSQPPGQSPTGTATSSSLAFHFSKRQLALAVAIAGISDTIGVFVALSPPIVWLLDVVTAILLFAVLGWQWLLLPGLVMEAIPGVAVLPFWLLVVAAIAAWGTARPKLK